MARDIELNLGDQTLEHGDVLENDIVRVRLYGPPGAPLIVIPGGISASRFVADNREEGHGWWADLVHAGGPIDLDQFQVMGVDLAPGDENTKRRLTITTRDQARRIGAILDHLDLTAHSMIGMSYGGMVALAFAAAYPEKLGGLCLLGATHRPYAMGVAWRTIQRSIIDLATELGAPDEGLKLARQLAMTTYRSPEEFSQRFNLEPIDGTPIGFDVGEYLQACGNRYPSMMAANRFLALSESIDLHRVDPADVTTPTLLIATDTDRLAPPSEKAILRDALAGPCEMITINSLYGHDSFLKETEQLSPIVKAFVEGARRAA